MAKDTSKIALFDLDGTLVDYDGHMRRSLEEIRCDAEEHATYEPAADDPPWLKARKRLIRSQRDWWTNIPLHGPGVELLRVAQDIGFQSHILTKGPYNTTNAWTEKVECCRNMFPDVPVTISEDKSLVYGRVLVDDWPEYVEPWLAARPRGIVVMPAHPWNADFRHERAIRYDGSNLSEVRRWLQAAFDRVRTK